LGISRDAPLTECPACHKAELRKLVSAAGFQLKGSGWYVTDFRGDKSAKKPADAAAAPPAGDASARPAGEASGAKPAAGAAPSKPEKRRLAPNIIRRAILGGFGLDAFGRGLTICTKNERRRYSAL